MKTLHLTLKKQYFDEILAGVKTEEYRQVKPYWNKRLSRYWFVCGEKHKIDNITHGSSKTNLSCFINIRNKIIKEYQEEWEIVSFDFMPFEFSKIIFYNGGAPSKKYPHFVIECLAIEIQRGIKTPLGKGDFFVIKLGKILETKNIKEVTK